MLRAMFSLPFELMMALRYLRPKRTYVSVISLISVIGVMLGVAVLIIVLSVMSGFSKSLEEKLFGFNAHLKVFSPGQPLSDPDRVADAVSKATAIKSVSPFVIGKVLVETQVQPGESPKVDAPWLRGMDPNIKSDTGIRPDQIIDGKFDLRGNGLIVGREFARNLNITVGDRVSIHSPRNVQRLRDSSKKDGDEAVLPEEFTIRGIFDVGYFEYNLSVVICSLANAQDLYELKDSVHGLMVNLADPFQAPQAQEELQAKLGFKYEVTTWYQENSSTLDAVMVEKQVMFYLLFFIMIVAAFGIASSLITFVIQKTREIGVLKALGATDWQIGRVFLLQSVIVGVIGVMLGCALGLAGVIYRNEFLDLMRSWTGFELFPKKIYNFNSLPAEIIPNDIMIICGGSILICIIAGIIPAWNAARMRPVEALRHE